MLQVERKLLVEKEKEKEVMRAKVFDQMKEIEETRRQSFIDIATAKADKQVKAQKRLVLKREVDREDMRLIGRAKEQQVARAQKAAAYKCTLMQQRLEESEEKQRNIKEARESMTKERKRMQRQAQIERAQMKEVTPGNLSSRHPVFYDLVSRLEEQRLTRACCGVAAVAGAPEDVRGQAEPAADGAARRQHGRPHQRSTSRRLRCPCRSDPGRAGLAEPEPAGDQRDVQRRGGGRGG